MTKFYKLFYLFIVTFNICVTCINVQSVIKVAIVLWSDTTVWSTTSHDPSLRLVDDELIRILNFELDFEIYMAIEKDGDSPWAWAS